MKKKEYYSIGIMSGTSMDGFDFSLIKSDGISNIKVLNNHQVVCPLKPQLILHQLQLKIGSQF